MAKGKGFLFMGLNISITWLMLLASFFFIKAISVGYESWFAQHWITISIVSGVIILIGLITGMITLRSMTKNWNF